MLLQTSNAEPGPAVATVSDGGDAVDHGLCTPCFPCDLVIGEVTVVRGLLGNGAVAGGHQSAVHDQNGAPAKPLARLECEQRAGAEDNPSGCRFRHPEQQSNFRHVGFVCQYATTSRPALQRQRPRPPRTG